MNVVANILEAWRVARTRFPEPTPTTLLVNRMALQPDPYFNDVPRVVYDKLARRALDVAVTQIGLAEDGKNGGPNVAKWIAPARCPANYCGGGVGWSYEQAANQFGVALPFRRSLGAKALGRNIAAVGRRFTDPAEVQPGDVAVWSRGVSGSWQGHIELCNWFSGRLHTVAFNSGPKVRHIAHAWPSPRFEFFASVRKTG